MNNISALKKSAAAIALVLGVAPGGAHAIVDTGLVAYWPLNDKVTDTLVADALKKCNGTKAGGVTFTTAPTITGSLAFPLEEIMGYEAVPLWHNNGAWNPNATGDNGPQFYGDYPRITKVARFDGSSGTGIDVPDSTTCTGIKTLPAAPAFTISAWARHEYITAMTDTTAPAVIQPILTRGTDWKLFFESKAEKVGLALNPNASAGRVDRIKFCTTTSNCLSYPPADLSRYMSPNAGDISGTYQYGNQLAYGQFPIRPGWWYNVTVTYTKAPAPVPVVGSVPPQTRVPPQAVMYINGVKVAESTPPTPPTIASPFPPPTATATGLSMGKDGTNPPLKGRIDDVRLYNVALKPSDVTILGQGCPPGTFDPKTGKVSLPCVVEMDSRQRDWWNDQYATLGAWQVDLQAVPPKPNPNNGGDPEKNMRFTVAKSTPISPPTGFMLNPYPNNWVPGEYPWGGLVAYLDANDYGAGRGDYDLKYQGLEDYYSNYYYDDFNYFYIPGVEVPGTFSPTVKECYYVNMYYDILNSRFELDYVGDGGQNCSGDGQSSWAVSKKPKEVVEEATPATTTP